MTTEREAQIIKKYKEDGKKHRNNISSNVPSRSRCCECAKRGLHKRVWAEQTVRFCKHHVDIWDTVISDALTNWD